MYCVPLVWLKLGAGTIDLHHVKGAVSVCGSLLDSVAFATDESRAWDILVNSSGNGTSGVSSCPAASQKSLQTSRRRSSRIFHFVSFPILLRITNCEKTIV